MKSTIEKRETFYSQEEALECQAQHKGAALTAHSGHGMILNGEWTYEIPKNQPAWTVSWYEPVEGEDIEIVFDPLDLDEMRDLMAKHGDRKFPFCGLNGDQEEVEISIFHEKIVIRTYQSNGWVRISTYWPDGSYEDIFNGKWQSAKEAHL